MRIALLDNGSLSAAAQRNLRAVAAALGRPGGEAVAAVSWKHSARIPAAALDGIPAWTLAPWVRTQFAGGEREFLFVPFFISPAGAIVSSLRRELEALAADLGGFTFSFTPGLADGTPRPLSTIVTDRVRDTVAARGLRTPAVIVVDHGGPSASSALVRDTVAQEVRAALGSSIGVLAAASMESPEGPDFAFNQPLFAAQLAEPGFERGEVVIAPLFLSPGRHAGPDGDLAQLARAASARQPDLRCHFTELVGSHPLAAQALAAHLEDFAATSRATP